MFVGLLEPRVHTTLFAAALCVIKYLTIILLSGCGSDSDGCVGRGSYYVPGHETVELNRGRMCKPIEVIGDKSQSPVIVQAEFERSIIRVEPDGIVAWRYMLPRNFKGNFVDQTADTISFTYKSDIITLNKDTGDFVSSVRLPADGQTFASRIDSDLITFVENRFNGRAIILSETAGIVFESRHRFAAARGIELLNNHILVIGDVFNHRVVGIDIDTDSIVFQVDDFFPSMGHVVSDTEILVVAEHANRIYKYDIDTGEKSWVYGCMAHPIFMELDRPYTDIAALGHTGDLTHPHGMGICAMEYNQDRETLYSVGGVVKNQDGTLLISDTDNHRVVHITEHKEFIRAINNINNPIRAIEIS